MPVKRNRRSSLDIRENQVKKRRTPNLTYEESDNESLEIGEEEYPIRCIIAETRTKYLIDWEGGYPPTWEPKACASKAAIDAWSEELLREREEREDELQRADYRRKRRALLRKSRLINSSSEESGTGNNPPTPSPQPDAPCFQISIPRSPSQDLYNTGENSNESSPDPFHQSRNSNVSSLSHLSSFTGGAQCPSIPTALRDTDLDSIPESVLPSCNARSITPQDFRDSDPSITDFSVDTPGSNENIVVASQQEIDQSGGDISTTVLSHISCSINSSLTGNSQSKQSHSTQGSGRSAHIDIDLTVTNFSDFEDQSFPDRLRENFTSSPAQYSNSQLSYDHLPSQTINFIGYSVNATSQSLNKCASSHHPSTQSSLDSRRQYSRERTMSFEQSTGERDPSIMDNNSEERRLTYEEAMDKWKHIPGDTGREKLKNAMAGMRTRYFGEVPPSGSVTPSSAGDIDPLPSTIAPEAAAPLSVRVEKENLTKPLHNEMNPPAVPEVQQPVAESFPVPQILSAEPAALQTIQPSALISEAEIFPPGSVLLGPSEFAIPVPMDSRIKDDYEKVLFEHATAIRAVLQNPDVEANPDEYTQNLNALRRAVEKLNNITVLPDLNIADHIQSSQPNLEQEASWAEYSSSKFQFLGHFLEVAADHDLHVIVMVNKIDFVERYFLGKGLVHTRPRGEMTGNVEVSLTNGVFSVGIQPTNAEGTVETYKRPSVILALDSSFNANHPSVELLRTTYASHGNLLPVVFLLVSNTSEHIQRCLPDGSENEKLPQLIRHVLRFRDIVGDLQDDALGVTEDAEELLSYLLSENFNTSWNLPAIEPLNLAVDELDSTLGLGSQVMAPPPLDFQNISGPKRTIDDLESDGPSVKRQRVVGTQETTTPTTQASNGGGSKSDTEQRFLGGSVAQMKAAHAEEIRRLQSALSEFQARLREKDVALGELQHRYESRTKEVHQVRTERDKLAENITKLEQKTERQKEELIKLKDERTQLKHELEAARNDLKAEGGLMAELEAAREENRNLAKENASLERKAEYEKKQAEYTREQYQNASTAAAQSGTEIRQLRDENVELKRRIEAEVIKLKEIKARNDETRHLQRVQELEQSLEVREDLLRRKEEELRNIRNNRPTTRATSSQPRSPKWGPGNSRPTSPGVNNSGLPGRASALRFSSEMSL